MWGIQRGIVKKGMQRGQATHCGLTGTVPLGMLEIAPERRTRTGVEIRKA